MKPLDMVKLHGIANKRAYNSIDQPDDKSNTRGRRRTRVGYGL